MNKYSGKKAAVLGLGIEGHDVVKYLLTQDASVTIFDKRPKSELDLSDIDEDKIDSINCGPGYLKDSLTGFDLVVRSPGVYPYVFELVEAGKLGVEVTSAIRMFFDQCPAKIIGVTGTKGKGTTSSLIYEILKEDKKDVYLVGNIGKPYLELLSKLSKDSWVVMEMSSFQLIDLDKSPHIAVILNVTEDHLDWHKDQSEYVEAKKNIVRFQESEDYAVINEEYKVSKSFAKETDASVVYFSKYTLGEGYKKDLTLRGEHNLENIAAAVAVAKILKIDSKLITKVVSDFKGLEHRLEFVREIGGVKFYNDSFATGPQPTIAAIKSFTEPETLILGGSDKGLDYKGLVSEIKNRKNVQNLILIGDVGQKLDILFKNSSFEGIILNLGYSKMQQIVDEAYKITPDAGVVILSPAAASFDMFENYKDRGNQFKKATISLVKRK